MVERGICWEKRQAYISLETLDIPWNTYRCKVDVTLGKEGGRYVWASPHSSSGGRGAEKGRQFCFFLWGFLDKKGETMLDFGLEKTKKIEN